MLVDDSDKGWTLVVRKDKRFREKLRSEMVSLEAIEHMLRTRVLNNKVYLQMNRGLTGVDVRFSTFEVSGAVRQILPVTFNAEEFTLTSLADRQWYLDDNQKGKNKGMEIDVNISYWCSRLKDRVVWVRVAKTFDGLEMYDHIPKMSKNDSRALGVLSLDIKEVVLERDDNGENVSVIF